MITDTLIARRTRTKGSTPGEAADRIRSSKSALIERALCGWGIANVFIVFGQTFLAPLGLQVGVNIGNLNKYFMFSLAAWIMVALLRNIAPLRMPWAMVCLICVQVWFTVSSIVSQLQLGTNVEFSATDYSLVTFLLCFLQASMLTYFVPDVRRILKITVVAVCLVSVFVAVLQFLGFGPAIQWANMMIGFEDISNWGGQGGIRATGIMPGVGRQVTYGLIAVALISSALFTRKLRPYEIAIIVVLTGVMFMAQVRNLLVVMAIVMIPLIVMFVRRHRTSAVPYIVAGVIALALLIISGAERFNYMFSGDTSTFEFRQDVLWPQAKTIYQERPWFGIGVEPSFAGVDTFIKSRWSDGIILDNGYLVALSFGGLPAFTFVVLAVFAGAIGSLRLMMRRDASAHERGFAIVAGIITLVFGYGMYFGNMFTNISMGMLYFVLLGAALPSGVGVRSTKLILQNGLKTTKTEEPTPAAVDE